MRKSLAVLLGLAAVVVLVATTAQAGTKSTKAVNVSLAGWSSGPDEDALVQQMVDKFNATHPTIHATWSVINGNYTEAMTARFAAHNPPDVFYVDSSVAPGWMGQGVLQSLNSFVKKSKYNTSAFYPSLLKAFERGKTIFGFPKDWSPLAMEINKVDLAKAGGKAPKTWAELKAFAQKIQAQNLVPNGKPICLSADWARMLPFVFQNGGSLANLTSPAAVNAASFYTGLVSSGLANTPDKLGGAGWCGQALGQGTAAVIFEGNWLIPYMHTTYPATKYEIFPMIKNRAGGNLAFTVSYSMAKDSKNKAAAWTLLSWLVGKQGEKLWMSKGLALSPRSDVATIGGRKPFLADAPVAHGWGFPNFTNAYTVMNNDLSAVLTGSKTVAEMMSDAAAALKG
jgi:multiple sugar transport system substrate-binding protein